MLIYNTSFHLASEGVIQEFLTFMKGTYLPAVCSKGYVTNPRFVRLLGEVSEGAFGYAVMIDCEGEAVALKKWRKEVGDGLLAALQAKFGTQVLTFSTAMKVVPFENATQPET